MSSASNDDYNNDPKEQLSVNTKKRLIRDITEIYKNPLNDQGIFYVHDDSNMLKGYAMIIGPKDTPYEHGFYFFEFMFPTNYPFSPPKLKYLTNDGVTRFNPNLYRNGKVCLSILNTWRGEAWSSCQSISSILLTIAATVLNETPLLNEPGIKESHRDYENYNHAIRYINYKAAILGVLKNEIASNISQIFKSFIVNYVKEHKEEILSLMVKHKERLFNIKNNTENPSTATIDTNVIINTETQEDDNKNKCKIVYISLYNFKTIVKYGSLYDELSEYLETL